MGEPGHTNNVRRIDFAKAAAKPARLPADKPAARQQGPGPAGRDRLKVVSLPEPRRRRQSHRPAQSTLVAVIVILATLIGVLVATILLAPAI